MTYLNEEWLSTSVGMSITFVVFMQGMPALVFQTLSANALRNIYNERFGSGWAKSFLHQLILIVFLFVFSNIQVCNNICPFCLPEEVVFLLLVLIVVLIFINGFKYLTNTFNSIHNIELQLSKKIADDIILYFNTNKDYRKKDIEQLRVLAQELPSGTSKSIFLNECERIIEYLLVVPNKDKNAKLISEILEDAVCLSITYDGALFNNENMRKVLDILILTYSHNQHNGMREATTSYLNTIIGNSIKEIGIKAMLKNDLPSVMDAVEKLSAIESTSREMFVLGNEALQHGHVQTAVAVVRKLGGKVRHNTAPGDTLSYDDKRTYYFWLGLVAKIYQLRGSAQNFAERQLQNVVLRFGDHRDEVHALFEETRRHFYHLADFATIDAVRELEEVLFPE